MSDDAASIFDTSPAPGPSAPAGPVLRASAPKKGKGGRPRTVGVPPLIDRSRAPDTITRAEAQAMASEAADAAVAKVLAALQSAAPQALPAGTPGDDMKAFVQQLAKSIAEVGNQGTGKVVVDPGVIQARDNAKVEMMTLIAQAWRDQTAPEYELSGKVHLNDQLIEPLWTDGQRQTHRTKIKWYGPPNKAMSPVEGNAVAEAIYEKFCVWVGHAPGVTSNLRPVDMKGRLVTPGGNIFESRDAIPKSYMGETLVVEEGARPPREVPHNGLEIAGRGPGGQVGKTRDVNILGTIAQPAREQVA